MRIQIRVLVWCLWLTGWALARPLSFPYREAGLTPEQAAAHLLSRMSFGPTPGQVERVAQTGLESWVEEQLSAPAPDPGLEALLATIPEESNESRLGQRKLLRAVQGQAQIREVMTDFWFNHFNVSLTDDDCRRYVANYESEAIRPNCLGDFQSLLLATARHPAMLYYLDNAYSVWEDHYEVEDRSYDPLHYGNQKPRTPPKPDKSRSSRKGLNENYAREVLELHTLGVDGGYRQQDVTELARILTGWSVDKNAFVFRAQNHDPNPKKFLYQKVEPNGQAEGEKVLEQLALRDATARFVTRKLAIRFVSDQPPQSLLTRLRRAYMVSRGDTRAILESLLESPEFWNPLYVGAKIKSPFELQASSLRILGAHLEARSNLHSMLGSMGQPIYCCRPPTGWPDRADTWLTPGTLVQRLSFAHQLASGQLTGVQFDLTQIRPNKPMGSATQALQAYAATLLPGRDNHKTVELLREAASDPTYSQAVIATSKARGRKIPKPKPKAGFEFTPAAEINIVGLLLGCPEFQRR